MTINNVSVNVNAAASALTKYLNEVEKIAEKVSLSIEDVDMIIRLNRKNLRFQEVHYRFWCEPSEGINALAKQSAMTVTEGKRSEDQERRYFYHKEMAKRNVANAQAQEVPMPEEPKKAKYMSAANMASLEASAPARAFNKDTIKAAAKRLAATKAKPAQAPASPTPAVVSEPTPVKEDTQKQMSAEDYANEILAEAGLDEWDVADITDSFKELCGSKTPEPEQVVETATVITPAAADDVAETTFIVPSFEEMMGFGSVSTYVEKDGEVVVDDGKDEDELTEEEKGKAPTPYQEALLKEAEENRDAGFMRLEDTTLMVSARVR